MAIRLQDKDNTTPPSVQNPYGQIKDDDGTGNGTPVNKEVYQDHHIFFAKISDYAGIVLNGILDNAYDGFQYFQALVGVIRKSIAFGVEAIFRDSAGTETTVDLKTKVIEIGDWDMHVSASGTETKLVPHGVPDHRKIRSVTGIIRSDNDNKYWVMGTDVLGFGPFSSGIGLEDGIGGLNIGVRVEPSSFYDAATFSATGFNRGWITIVYEA